MKKTIENALKLIKPTTEEEESLNRTLKKIKEKIKIPGAKLFLGGSVAKGTWLSNLKDIDIFLRFETIYKDQDISKLLKKALEKLKIGIKELHGSRDYYQYEEDNHIIELIPIIEIKEAKEALNITDISPLHVKWVKEHPEFKDEIRLAKAFAKAQKCYGAESYIKGFSGYSLEILTIYYKGFAGLLKAASFWGKEVIIDPERYHTNPKEDLNPSKLAPMILIDPVEKERNVTAGLSQKKLEIFKKQAIEFLKNPKEEFFKRNDTLPIEKEDEQLIKFEVEVEEGKEDVNGCKILKIFERIKNELEKEEFTLKESDWIFDKNKKGLLWYLLKKEKLSETFTRTGPPITAKENAKQFKEKHKGSYEKKGRLYAEVKRKYRTAEELINAYRTLRT